MKFASSCILIVLIFSSCKNSIKQEQLYGEWKYIKVENPKQNPAYIMPDDEVKANSPSIKFSGENDLVIIWGGRQLSNGKFRMEDRMIRYKENLEGGQTREFPFLVQKISADSLVFETMEHDFTRVTAVKVKH